MTALKHQQHTRYIHAHKWLTSTSLNFFAPKHTQTSKLFRKKMSLRREAVWKRWFFPPFFTMFRDINGELWWCFLFESHPEVCWEVERILSEEKQTNNRAGWQTARQTDRERKKDADAQRATRHWDPRLTRSCLVLVSPAASSGHWLAPGRFSPPPPSPLCMRNRWSTPPPQP